MNKAARTSFMNNLAYEGFASNTVRSSFMYLLHICFID
jgi:hypothetical protein